MLDCTFDATLTTLSEKPMSFVKIVQWATSDMQTLDQEQALAFEFLDLCMELNPQKRISAADALRHPFLSNVEDDQLLDDDVFLS
jgi:cell division control protein 7